MSHSPQAANSCRTSNFFRRRLPTLSSSFTENMRSCVGIRALNDLGQASLPTTSKLRAMNPPPRGDLGRPNRCADAFVVAGASSRGHRTSGIRSTPPISPIICAGGAVTDRCHRARIYAQFQYRGAIRRPPHAPLAYAYAGAHVEELLSLRRAPFQLQRGKKQYFASDFTRHAAPDAGAADACRCG